MFTLATRTSPSRPRVVSTTLPRGQIPLGVKPLSTLTTSSTFRGGCMLSVHWRLLSNVSRYSLFKRRHTWFINCWTCFQFLKLAGCWSPKFPCYRELYGRWMRKWLRLSGSLFSGWSATFVKGLEFRVASTSTIIVSKMSKEKLLDPRMTKRSESIAPARHRNEGLIVGWISMWFRLQLGF